MLDSGKCIIFLNKNFLQRLRPQSRFTLMITGTIHKHVFHHVIIWEIYIRWNPNTSLFQAKSYTHQWMQKSVNKYHSDIIRVAMRFAEKESLTFPWHFPDCQHKFQSLSRYIPCGDFLQNIQNHIEITLFINRCFNLVLIKIGQHKRTFSTSGKLAISCSKHYAKHENI